MSPVPAARTLTWREILSYGAADTGCNFHWANLATFLMFFDRLDNRALVRVQAEPAERKLAPPMPGAGPRV